mgnify:CR=1 FL=1
MIYICRAFSVPFRRGKSVRTVPPGSGTKIERHNRQPAPDPHPPSNHHYGRFQRLSRQQIHTEDTESRNTAHRNGLFGFPDALPSFSKKKALTTSISAATNIRGNGDCSTISFFPAACWCQVLPYTPQRRKPMCSVLLSFWPRPEIRRRTTLPHLLRHEISRGIQWPPARMGRNSAYCINRNTGRALNRTCRLLPANDRKYRTECARILSRPYCGRRNKPVWVLRKWLVLSDW